MLPVDLVMVDSLHDRLPSFGLDLPSGAGAAIVVGRHLGENSIAQSQRRIAEALEMESLQQFLIDGRAGNDNLRAARADAFDLAALRYWQARQSLRYSSHFRGGDDGPLVAAAATQVAGDSSEGCRCAGCRNHLFYLRPTNAASDAIDFAGHKAA